MIQGTSAYNWIESCTLMALLLPLISFIISIVISQRYAWTVAIVSPLLMLISALSACLVFITLFKTNTSFALAVDWFTVGNYKFSAGIYLDHQSIIMLPVVTIISFLVHLYSTGYMAGDKAISRYFAMLGFFTFSMLGIVMADNLLLIFVFWELVGFSSYLLIGHWTEKPEAAFAAKKAFIFNRIGDAGFLIGLMIIWANTGSFTVHEIFYHEEILHWQTAASLCIFCGVIGKSAQFPLLTWLPDAMEGPTPVSALIHAATMVAAGVFLLAKTFSVFTPEALNVVAIVGALTSLMAALSALVQIDLKKILAYSTISQLGFMVMAIGTGNHAAAMTHLFTHAFFKAGLFLGAGAIIYSLHQFAQQTHNHFNAQDIRYMGGLKKYLPVTSITFMLCSAALAGLPMFSGFLSKDAILTGIWNWNDGTSWKWIIVVTSFLIPFLTMIYTFRMNWFIFFGENRTKKVTSESLSIVESPVIMRLPLIILAACSLWFVIAFNPFSFSGWLFNSLHTGEVLHSSLLTAFSAVWVLVALLFAYFYFKSRKEIKASALNNLLLNSFHLDGLYNSIITTPVENISRLTEKFDLKWIDGTIHFAAYAQVTISHCASSFEKIFINGTVNGMARIARLLGALTRSFQGGKIQLYIFWAILGIIIFIFWMLG